MRNVAKHSFRERAKSAYFLSATILDINYVDFLQFKRDFIPQEELKEAFIYIIHPNLLINTINIL